MISVVFVCEGNICRSPTAEGIFSSLAANAGLSSHFEVDSAGTTAYHVGQRADARMRKHASRRGYELNSRARKFSRADLQKFDYVIAMDYGNFLDIQRMDRDQKYKKKIYMMNDFSVNYKGQDVPDPYYGGAEGFETVLDMLEESCSIFLDKVKQDNGL